MVTISVKANSRSWPRNKDRLDVEYTIGSVSSNMYRQQRFNENNKNAEINQRWLRMFKTLFVEEFNGEATIISLFEEVFAKWEKGGFFRWYKPAPSDVLKKMTDANCSEEHIRRFEKVQKKYSFEITKAELKELYVKRLQESETK